MDYDEIGFLAIISVGAVAIAVFIALILIGENSARDDARRYEIEKITACTEAGGAYHENAPGIPSTCEQS